MAYLDDEAALGRMGCRLLGTLGYRATVETEPARLLALIGEDPTRFDLVITDFSMPAMSGLELARAVSATRPDLPILLLSGYLDFDEAELAEAGVRRVLRKPMTMQELAAAIHEMLHPPS